MHTPKRPTKHGESVAMQGFRLGGAAGSLKQRGEVAAVLYGEAIAILEPAVEPSHPTLVACRDGFAAVNADPAHG